MSPTTVPAAALSPKPSCLSDYNSFCIEENPASTVSHSHLSLLAAAIELHLNDNNNNNDVAFYST